MGVPGEAAKQDAEGIEHHLSDVRRGTTAEQDGALLNDKPLLGILRTVLKDYPLVVRADTIGGDAAEYIQPSRDNPSPSPAERLAVLALLGEAVVIDVVRESHKLAELTPGDLSRWASEAAPAVLAMAARDRMVD